jgi:purine-binding chemotaxis protein CheW
METSRAVASAAEELDIRQYLTFGLGGEEYGVDILRVQEVKGWTEVTKIPRAPKWMSGVLNLRGVIVPIIDMRARFELGSAEFNRLTVIIVINVGTGAQARPIGIVVDQVSDVVDVDTAGIKPPPSFGTALDSSFLVGLADVSDKMVMLLDADKLLSDAEINSLPSS